MLLLRLAGSKQAPDAPTLISSTSSTSPSSSSSLSLSPIDTKPKVKPQSQSSVSAYTATSKSRGAAPVATPVLLSHSLNVDDANQQQQSVESSSGDVGGGDGPTRGGSNIASARLLDLGKKLIEATRQGLIEQVRQLVESSGAPFTSDWLGTTALHVAAQCGHADIAEILVRGGVNREARTKLERTALHLAAQSGSVRIVDLLVSHGSDVNARDMLKMTPLHWAVERNHMIVVERLLIAGADLRACNKFLLTPLDIARDSGLPEMIELLQNWSGDNKTDANLAVMTSASTGAKSFGVMLSGGISGDLGDDILDLDYRFALAVDGHTTATNSSRPAVNSTMLMPDEPSCIDLVGFEWNKCEFDPNLLLSASESDDEPKVEYLMKVVEELQKENQQLRQKVDQLSTTDEP